MLRIVLLSFVSGLAMLVCLWIVMAIAICLGNV